MKLFEDYIDDWDLVVQGPPSRDGGDGVHRHGMIATFAAVYSKILQRLDHLDWAWDLHKFRENILKHFMHSDGSLRRHPNPEKWYGGDEFDCWRRMSRDGYSTLLSGVASWRSYGLARKIVKKKRAIATAHCWKYLRGKLGLLPAIVLWPVLIIPWRYSWDYHHRHNHSYPGDGRFEELLPGAPTLFATWGLEMRACYDEHSYWSNIKHFNLRPWREFCDLHLVLSSIHWRLFRKDDGDINTHLAVSLAAYLTEPTWMSRLNMRLFPWTASKAKMFRYYSPTVNSESIGDMLPVFTPIREHFEKTEWFK